MENPIDPNTPDAFYATGSVLEAMTAYGVGTFRGQAVKVERYGVAVRTTVAFTDEMLDPRLSGTEAEARQIAEGFRFARVVKINLSVEAL